MASRSKARIPISTAALVSRALDSARAEVSCLTRRQCVPVKRLRRTSSCVVRHPRRYLSQAPGHRPTSNTLGTADLAEWFLKPDRHAVLHNGPPCGEVPAHRGQSQGVQAQEGRQVRSKQGR